MPDDPATDDGGQINPFGETLLEQHADQAVLAQGADQTVDGHRRDVTDRCAQLQAETAMGAQQGIAGGVRVQLSVAQNEMRQHGENGFTPCALDTPNGEAAKPDTGVNASGGSDRRLHRWICDGAENPGRG